MKRIVFGLLVILVSETGMLLKVEPFWSWHTTFAWTGYIALVDGIVYRRRGTSWLSDSLPEFVFVACLSIPLWLVFEFYNLFIRNWHYINLPESPFWRNLGYAWAFATIWPAIFETAELVASFRERVGDARPRASARGQGGVSVVGPLKTGPGLKPGAYEISSIAAGAAMLIWPLVWPSQYLAAPVWLGFIFVLDPPNALAGGASLTVDWRRGRIDRAINLALAGLLCGFLWEFWNYFARTKWVYTVPILPNVKLFEMPLPGYLGFPAFALECFTMYETVRLLLWRGRARPIGL